MSLPHGFANAEEYFNVALRFLRKYNWIYREANVACISAGIIDAMPDVFQDYFQTVTNDEFNIFPFLHERIDCPNTLLEFRHELARLIPITMPSTTTSTTWNHHKPPHRMKMSPKKQHEIAQLATHIHTYCQKGVHLHSPPVLIDVGAGLGYLSEALYEINPNFRIIGLEADPQRVEAARQRCQQLLPQVATTKSISYHEVYVRESSTETHEFIKREMGTKAIIGLHACADLSISAMRLFLEIPDVRQLHIMPCCYHKMEQRINSDNGGVGFIGFINFPLSAVLRGAVVASSSNDLLNRPFLRLACQQTSARWRSASAEEHSTHARQMFKRALVEAIVNGDYEQLKLQSKSKSAHAFGDDITFEELQNSYHLQCRQSQKNLNWQPEHRRRFDELIERYGRSGRGLCLVEALTCLQTAMQKLCENLVLFDRLCYLEEQVQAANIKLRARYVKLLDEKLSPRCFVLCAEKLS